MISLLKSLLLVPLTAGSINLALLNKSNDLGSKYLNGNNIVNDYDQILNGYSENKNLSFSLLNYSQTSTSASLQFQIKLSDDREEGKDNFFVGYFEEQDKQFPAQLSYKVTEADGRVYYETTAINKKNTNGNFDGIGKYVGNDKLLTYCDIPSYPGRVIDIDSIKIINVFEAKLEFDGNGNLKSSKPIYENKYYLNSEKSKKFAEYNFNDFLEFSFDGSSKYQGYTALKLKCKSHGEEMYKKLLPHAYNKNLNKIKKGDYYIRTKFTFAGESKLLITYKNNETENVNIISSSIEFSNDINDAVILIKDIDFKNVKNFQFINPYINLSIFNRSSGKNISGSNVKLDVRFHKVDCGVCDVVDRNNNVLISKSQNTFNYDLGVITLIITLVYSLIYIGIDLFMYKYLKEKNKNDEFKRMRSGQYFKTSTVGYIYLLSLINSIVAIVFRTTIFKNSLVVYNPLDIPIIIFSVISIILTGYFVKYFWSNYKAYKEKMNNIKLKIDNQNNDDGTIITKK